MVHRKEPQAVDVDDRGMSRIEVGVRARQFAPRETAQTYHHRGPHEVQLGVQMRSAIRNLARARITVSAACVARIAAHQVGDKDAVQPGLANHPPQQFARAIAAERNTGAIAAQAARRQPHERHARGSGAVAGHHARAAAHQRGAAAAREHRGAELVKGEAPAHRATRNEFSGRGGVRRTAAPDSVRRSTRRGGWRGFPRCRPPAR
jgi:hypothetical protein